MTFREEINTFGEETIMRKAELLFRNKKSQTDVPKSLDKQTFLWYNKKCEQMFSPALTVDM